MNPTSRLPLTAGGEFTQPRVRLLADPVHITNFIRALFLVASNFQCLSTAGITLPSLVHIVDMTLKPERHTRALDGAVATAPGMRVTAFLVV